MSENHRPPIRATDPVDRLNAALEGRYHVERELGEGGMATVYLAADLRHERKVFVSGLLRFDYVGLEEISDGVWAVYYGPVFLGWLDEDDYRIMDVRAHRRRCGGMQGVLPINP